MEDLLVEVKLFVREDRPGCSAARRACNGFANLSIYDLSEPSGFAAASALNVHEAPSVVVVDSSGSEVAAWRGAAPDASDIRAILAN